jgi:protein LTV1
LREKDAPISVRANEGEAALYDIFYDDTEYDYMQHLRPTGAQEAVFIPAPRTQKPQSKTGIDFVPDKEALPTEAAAERPYSEIMGIPDKPYGLQPDMDPKLREVLEALEDEAYVDGDENTEDFFSGLVGSGERDEDEEWEDEEDGDREPEIASGWQQEMAKFKKSRSGSDDGFDEEDEDFGSEGGDTIAELQAASLRRPRRKAVSNVGSGVSMSSSAMFRNEGLRTLDDRFDAVGSNLRLRPYLL